MIPDRFERVRARCHTDWVLRSNVPGPEPTDPITLVADGDFVAEIALREWRVVGAPAVVHRKNQGPWPGTLKALRPAVLIVAQWHLATGERREQAWFAPDDTDLRTGAQFPVRTGAHTWTATVIEDHSATSAIVGYEIKGGQVRDREFFRLGALGAYATPAPDGGMEVRVFGEQPDVF